MEGVGEIIEWLVWGDNSGRDGGERRGEGVVDGWMDLCVGEGEAFTPDVCPV